MYHFIVNPASRSGKGMQLWNQTAALLKRRKIAYQVHFTKYTYHAVHISREITSAGQPVVLIALGGDGTINEVIGGIINPDWVTLGYIPTGSSNDLARSAGLPADPEEALAHILAPKKIIYMDIGTTRYKNKSRDFAVSSGIGFDAAICQRTLISPLKQILNQLHLGKLTYVLTALTQLISFRPFRAEITLDDEQVYSYSRVFFIAAMNQKYQGGGLKLAPSASCSDGRLDICIVEGLPKLLLLLLLPTAYFGKHTRFPYIHMHRCKKIHIRTDKPAAIHTDGESCLLQSDVVMEYNNKRIKLIV